MATKLKQEPTTAPSPGLQSNCVDPLDIDRYINFEPALYPSPSVSPLSSQSKPVVTPSSSDNILPLHTPQEQTFSGPSHQYEQYKQQAGLPVGGLANTFALNEPDPFSFDQMQYTNSFTPIDGYFGMNTSDDYIDFGTNPGQVSSTDIDMDFGSPSEALPMLNSNTFIDPSTLAGQERQGTTTPTVPSHGLPGRVWPGMHQQQAALAAKAQADAQRQRQQQAMQQQSNTGTPHSRQSSHGRHDSADPHVTESISRLLDHMRRSSAAASNDDDDAATPGASGHGSGGRIRKDEEDMDEDERILASEEGKKLSSKERRQLRNKVSARAFRSRRKEYIGQLEGELAAKASEADDLRAKNEALTAENTRLADLTRMLLSSSAFSTFLDDLSATGGAPASLPSQIMGSTPQQSESTPRKDVNPNHSRQPQGQSQNNLRVGLAMIPESPFEFSASESTNHSWTASNNMDTGLYDAQVYAVSSLPEPPVLDSFNSSILSGKTSYSYCSATSKTGPTFERIPAAIPKDLPTLPALPCHDVEFDESDPSLTLFADQPSPCSMIVEPADRIFGEIELEKAFSRIELILSNDSGNGEVGAATLARFKRLSARMEDEGRRIEAVTEHL